MNIGRHESRRGRTVLAGKRREWIDADSRVKRVGDLGNKAESETQPQRWSAACELGQLLARGNSPDRRASSLGRQVINPAAAHHSSLYADDQPDSPGASEEQS